jgi:hypothetical protein
MGIWMVGTLQTAQDRARLREGLTTTGLDAGKVDTLLDATRKRVFLLHDIHRAGPCLLHSRWAMSYLRGPITRDEIARLMRDRVADRTSAAKAQEAKAESRAPVLPAPFRHNYLAKYGAELADPFLFVKYAVRYKGAGEVVGARAYPLGGSGLSEILEADPVEIEESALTAQAPNGVRYADLPSYLAEAGARGIEKILKERLPDKLALKAYVDPVTKEESQPGEDKAAFAARVQAGTGGAAAAKIKDRLDKKSRDLAAAEQDLQGRKTEKWTALGSAVLQNIGLFMGRKRSISGAGAVLTKNRMENNAEARVEGLRAEVADLTAELERVAAVDPSRFEEESLVPARTAVKVLRYDLVWIS